MVYTVYTTYLWWFWGMLYGILAVPHYQFFRSLPWIFAYHLQMIPPNIEDTLNETMFFGGNFHIIGTIEWGCSILRGRDEFWWILHILQVAPFLLVKLQSLLCGSLLLLVNVNSLHEVPINPYTSLKCRHQIPRIPENSSKYITFRSRISHKSPKNTHWWSHTSPTFCRFHLGSTFIFWWTSWTPKAFSLQPASHASALWTPLRRRSAAGECWAAGCRWISWDFMGIPMVVG